MTGTRQSAEAFLKGLLDGTFNYYSAEQMAGGDITENASIDTVSGHWYNGF